jgi:hypothetical protein
MFAGLFAMISAFVHVVQIYRSYREKQQTHTTILKYRVLAGIYILIIAYLYFLFTGPGIIHFETRSMDQSLFVELIKSGRFILPSLERLLYIDSLVMIGSNVILLSCLTVLGFKLLKNDTHRSWYLYVLGVVVLLISAFRIPLYASYLEALDNGQYGKVLLLNFIVNKNNPILPFLAFALFGGWMATLVIDGNKQKTRSLVLINGILYFVVGVVIYLTAEETMLERQIDYTWYGIMVFQIGLFQLFILGILRLYQHNDVSKLNRISRFFYRFGVAGLTLFFIEQIVSSIIKQVLLWISPDLYLGLYQSIVLGLLIAILWGFVLILWQRKDYKYGLEYFYTKWMKPFGGSEKADKLSGQ